MLCLWVMRKDRYTTTIKKFLSEYFTYDFDTNSASDETIYMVFGADIISRVCNNFYLKYLVSYRSLHFLVNSKQLSIKVETKTS